MLKRKLFENYQIKKTGFGELPPVHFSFILNDFFPFNLIVKKHPNLKEFEAILTMLKSRHSYVYITDYRYNKKIPDCDYFFGFGKVANNLNYEKSKSVYYSTGASSFYQIEAVHNELTWMSEMYGYSSLEYFRLPEELNTAGELNSKIHFGIGNDWTKLTFNKSTHMICLPGISNVEVNDNSSFRSDLGNNLLWIGSKGIFHKGLHLAAQVAFELKKKLYVVGVGGNEFSAAKNILEITKCDYEIFPFIKIPSNSWFEIINDCRFCLGCSISEGMSTSLLTALHYGVYPISFNSCGIDYGSVITPSSLNNRVSLLTSTTDELLKLNFSDFNDLVINDFNIMLKKNNLTEFNKVLSDNYNV
jgi:hypothetical protein